jgi:hypothetical protein
MLQEMYYWMMFYLGKVKTNDMPKFNAYLLMCLLVSFNIMTILIVIFSSLNIDHRKLLMSRQDTKIIGGTLEIIVFIFNYFYLYKNINQILQKHDKLVGKRRLRGMFFFWIYAIASIVSLFTLGPALT